MLSSCSLIKKARIDFFHLELEVKSGRFMKECFSCNNVHQKFSIMRSGMCKNLYKVNFEFLCMVHRCSFCNDRHSDKKFYTHLHKSGSVHSFLFIYP